jgi:hypothetical protein
VDGPRCPRAPENARPRGFLINKGSASGVFQDDFKNGEVQHSRSRSSGDDGRRRTRINSLTDSHLYKPT